MRRPLHLKCIAADASGFVAVPLKCPGVNELAPFLPDRSEFQVWTMRLDPGFLLEFAHSRIHKRFILRRLAFGNGPMTVIFFLKQGTARMGNKNLQCPVFQTKHQQAGTDSRRHGSTVAPAGERLKLADCSKESEFGSRNSEKDAGPFSMYH